MNSQQISEDDQGFIPTKLIAKLSDIEDIRDSKGKQCKMFNAFYLPTGQGNMKLQLPESLHNITQFDIEDQNPNNQHSPQNKNKNIKINRNYSNPVILQHPYKFYAQNSVYHLIYSRNCSEEPLYNQFQYIRNDVLLKTVESSKESQGQKKSDIANTLRNPYSRSLKPFQYTSLNPIQRNYSDNLESSSKNNNILYFDSRFQSGNLYCAYNKNSTNQYHLFLQNDTNSYGYNQWFYFSIANIRKNVEYNLVIVNFKKRNSFFRQGFKPILFSLKKYQHNGNKNGWFRAGYNIQYQESHVTTSKFFKFYKLSFTLKFQYDNDYVLIAANLPYSYSRLSSYLEKFTKQFKQSNQNQEIADFKISPLGRTFCGNTVPQIKIVPVLSQEKKFKSPNKSKKKQSKKKMIIFLARQHPGETVSSFLMEKILQNISTFGIESENESNEKSQIKQQIKFILKNYTILIYPMVNIDGVIYGNSRCDVSGMDLNRRWKNPSKIFHPQIFNIKNRIEHYTQRYDIVGCFDLHGHSKLYNVFCYSCKINPLSCRILPYLISKETNKFYFPSCTFGISRYKSTTARAAIFKAVKNQNVLTIQMSYFGFVQTKQLQQNSKITQKNIIFEKNAIDQQKMYESKLPSAQKIKWNPKRGSKYSKQKGIIKYFQPQTFEQIAQGILTGLSIFLNKQTSSVYIQIQSQIKQKLQQILNFEKSNQYKQDSGSQSDPQGDQIDFQTKIQTILGKQFLEQAMFFKPAQQQNIDVNQLMSTQSLMLGQQQNYVKQKIISTESVQFNKNESKQKIQHLINKIRRSKRKNEGSDHKTLSNQKFQKQLNFVNPVVSKTLKANPKKQTISFSLQKNYKPSEPQKRQKTFSENKNQKKTINVSQKLYSQNAQRLMMANKKYSQMLIRDQSLEDIEDQNQPVTPKVYDDLIIYSAQSKDLINFQKRNLLQRPSISSLPVSSSNQFFIKFQKFLPSHPLPPFNKKQKLSFLQESIYKDDQRQILNTLLQNKKRLQKQKQRRQIQKSTTIAERHHYSGVGNKTSYGRRRQEEGRREQQVGGIFGYGTKRKSEIVDFRKFKDRQKLKIQLKQLNDNFSKYLKKQTYN